MTFSCFTELYIRLCCAVCLYSAGCLETSLWWDHCYIVKTKKKCPSMYNNCIWIKDIL